MYPTKYQDLQELPTDYEQWSETGFVSPVIIVRFATKPKSVKRSKVYRNPCRLWYRSYTPHANTRQVSITSSCRKLVGQRRVIIRCLRRPTRVDQALETHSKKFKLLNFRLQALFRHRLREAVLFARKLTRSPSRHHARNSTPHFRAQGTRHTFTCTIPRLSRGLPTSPLVL